MMSALLTTVYMLNSGCQGAFYYVTEVIRYRRRIMQAGFVLALLKCPVINVYYNRKRHENS